MTIHTDVAANRREPAYAPDCIRMTDVAPLLPRCRHCGKPLCDCPDPVFAGVLPGATPC